MTQRRICHERALDCGALMTHEDALAICRNMAGMLPGTMFFAPAGFQTLHELAGSENKWVSGYRKSGDLKTLHADPFACFRALRREQAQFQRSPAVLIAMRAPWPEEIETGDVMLIRGQQYAAHTSLSNDDPQEWRDKGRLIEIVVPAETVQVARAVDMQEYNWLRNEEGEFKVKHPIFKFEDFGDANGVSISCHFAHAFSWYNLSDPETALFMATFRRFYNAQVTSRIAWYDPATGQYLDRYRGRNRRSVGRGLLRWLCHHPNVFETFSVLGDENPGFSGRLAGKGPAPDFKAEVFLEEGLPIDDIAGLTDQDKDQLKRRFENKQKLAAKAAASA